MLDRVVTKVRSEGPLSVVKSSAPFIRRRLRRHARGFFESRPFTHDLHLLVHREGPNPILTGRDVNDVPNCQFVADPFLVIDADSADWHVFFELMPESGHGLIGHAQSRDHGETWRYTGVVLEEDVHLSFPFVFLHRDTYYMIPERGGRSGGTIDLYEATRFPYEWVRRGTMIESHPPVGDSVIFRWGGLWWLLHGHQGHPTNAYYNDRLAVHGWSAHQYNPILTRSVLTRPAGRPLHLGDRLVLFFQDCSRTYGERIVPFEVTTLTPDAYRDRQLRMVPQLELSGYRGWNARKMHHIDCQRIADQYVCLVDGDAHTRSIFGRRWGIGQFRFSEPPIRSHPDAMVGREVTSVQVNRK